MPFDASTCTYILYRRNWWHKPLYELSFSVPSIRQNIPLVWKDLYIFMYMLYYLIELYTYLLQYIFIIYDMQKNCKAGIFMIYIYIYIDIPLIHLRFTFSSSWRLEFGHCMAWRLWRRSHGVWGDFQRATWGENIFKTQGGLIWFKGKVPAKNRFVFFFVGLNCEEMLEIAGHLRSEVKVAVSTMNHFFWTLRRLVALFGFWKAAAMSILEASCFQQFERLVERNLFFWRLHSTCFLIPETFAPLD